MRNLYIIQGIHSSPETVNRPAEMKRLRGYEAVYATIFYAIANQRRVTHVFGDGISKKVAVQSNGILEKLLTSTEEEKAHLDTVARKVAKEIAGYESPLEVTEMNAMMTLNKAGIPIRYYETELEDCEDPYTILAQARSRNDPIGKSVERLWPAIEGIRLAGKPLETTPGISELYCAIRDETVYANVLAQAGKESILWMGVAHELSDFCYREHDFNVTWIEVNENDAYNVKVQQNSYDYQIGLIISQALENYAKVEIK